EAGPAILGRRLMRRLALAGRPDNKQRKQRHRSDQRERDQPPTTFQSHLDSSLELRPVSSHPRRSRLPPKPACCNSRDPHASRPLSLSGGTATESPGRRTLAEMKRGDEPRSGEESTSPCVD